MVWKCSLDYLDRSSDYLTAENRWLTWDGLSSKDCCLYDLKRRPYRGYHYWPSAPRNTKYHVRNNKSALLYQNTSIHIKLSINFIHNHMRIPQKHITRLDIIVCKWDIIAHFVWAIMSLGDFVRLPQMRCMV